MPNRQKLNFSPRKTLAPRIKHKPFSCYKFVFFIIWFSLKYGLECFNYFILLYLCSRTCQKNNFWCKKHTLITQPSKVTVLACLEGSKWGGHIFFSCKKENPCWLSQTLFNYTEKTGPNSLLYNGFHKRHLSSVPVIVCVVWIITRLLAILSNPVSTMVWAAEFRRETSLSPSVAHSCIAPAVRVFLRDSVVRELLVLGNSCPVFSCCRMIMVPHHAVF